MSALRVWSAALSVVFVCAACESTSTPDDAGITPTDTGVPVDAAPGVDSGGDPIDGGGMPVDAFVPPTDGGGMPGCGTDRPTISGITGTEGLVIARDGTIYYSQSGGVGRLPVGGTPENNWVRITGASTVWGLALDAANETLYAGSPSTGTIYAIDLTAATAIATPFVTGAGQPNGLTLGPDGALYFSNFGGGHVNRVALGGATGTATRVTSSTIAQANGVAFLPDGTLLVASYMTGTLHRLTLSAGAETARATFATDLGSPDGIAIDAAGRVYVTDNVGRTVIRLEPDGTGPMIVLSSVSAAASLDFGAGPLDCEDLYVASSAAMRRYEDGTTPGAAVPWH